MWHRRPRLRSKIMWHSRPRLCPLVLVLDFQIVTFGNLGNSGSFLRGYLDTSPRKPRSAMLAAGTVKAQANRRRANSWLAGAEPLSALADALLVQAFPESRLQWLSCQSLKALLSPPMPLSVVPTS